MNKDKHISTRVNHKLHKMLKDKAQKEGMKFSEAIRFALRKWVEQ